MTKGPSSAEQSAVLVIRIVLVVWAISVLADIFVPGYNPPVSMFAGMTALAAAAGAYLFYRRTGGNGQ